MTSGDYPAVARALNDIAFLEGEGHITPEVAQRGRDVIGLIFQPDSVYASICPIDDGDLSFYWRAGDRSISIDLYQEGGLWCRVVDDQGKERSFIGDGPPEWMYDALADFSAAVEAVNPAWREQIL